MAIVHVASSAVDLDVSDGPSVAAVLTHTAALVTLPAASVGVLTLKVDGVVFDPSSNVPASASVLEVIEWLPITVPDPALPGNLGESDDDRE